MTLIVLAAFFVGGVYIASRFDIPLPVFGLIALASALSIVLLIALRRSPKPAFIILVLMSGFARVEMFESNQLAELVAYHSRLPVEIEGVVIDDPAPAGVYTRLRVRVERIRPGDAWLGVSEDVQVTLRESTELVRLRDRPYFRYGDRLMLKGPLEPPRVIEEFDYPAYLARQGITTVILFPSVTLLDEGQGSAFYQWLYGVRQSLAASLSKAVPEPQASLGQALLLGIRDNLPDELVDDFQRTGTSHVLAISGLHVSIVLGLSLLISQRVFGRRNRIFLVVPLVLIWLYALVSGASPSAIRASIMGSVFLFALAVGRPRIVLPSLGLAAAIMVAVSPNVIQSVSFQLSFAAMAGIAVIAEPLGLRLKSGLQGHSSVAAWLIDTTAMTVAATIATLPIVAFYFERVSLLGIPATALVLPALPFVLVSQAGAGFVGLFSPVIAQLPGWFAWMASSYVTGVVGLMARLGGSIETGAVATPLVWVYYVVLICLAFALSRMDVFRKWLDDSLSVRHGGSRFGKSLSIWIAVPIVGVAALVWVAAQFQTDDRLHVVFVDVGQGDGVFIETPGGHQIVVDGGPDPANIMNFIGRRMSVTDRTIDLVVLSHAHADHVTGLTEVLHRYDAERILERRIEYDSPAYEAWRRAVSDEGAAVIQAQTGQRIDFGDGVVLEVISPPESLLRGTASDTDNASVAFRLIYGDVSFLLTGDMYGEAERALVRNGVMIDSDVLKVAHHGSRSSSTQGFLEAVSPAIAVIQAGVDNRFNHPHAETVEALRRFVSDERLLMTKDHGTIEVITDGHRIQINTEKKPVD